MKRQFFLILILAGVSSGLLHAQQSESTITGTVHSKKGEAIDQAYIHLMGTGLYTQTDSDGRFSLTVPAGTYQLIASRIGFEKDTLKIQVSANEEKELNIVLSVNPKMQLDEVTVFAKSVTREINETAYNVTAVDATELHNSTMDISQVLDKISGVKIRESGGVGSNSSISLNGFSGRHVKFFIDGVPMQGYGPAFEMNNIPVNMAERIEVYKGVVPVSFGSDALGGAVNIVTSERANTYLDASYSYGSFNTHKSNLNMGYTSQNGFRATLNAYQNYSDNDYQVDAKILNLEQNIFEQERQEVNRFHDGYHNESVIGKIGVVNKSFADKLLLGFTFGNEYDEIQHPTDMSFVYGKRTRESRTLIPSILYQKDDLFIDNLNVSLNAYHNFGSATSVDTVSRRYNWQGDYVEQDRPGELSYSIYEYRNRNSTANANITYTFVDRHAITLNNTFTGFSRKGHDEVAPSPTDDYPRESFKNVLGAAYKFKYSERWNTSIFFKHYLHTVKSYVSLEGYQNYDHHSATNNYNGFGAATTYFITENLQLKASYEQTLRLPTGRELFGSGDGLQVGNQTLNPEKSDNINIGFSYDKIIDNTHIFNVNTNLIYRRTQDYIRRQISPSSGTSGSINEGLVVNKGIDTELRYSYNNLFSVGATFTYQDIRNKLKYRNNSTVISTIYDDRVPNVPYLYGNGDFTVFFDDTFWQGDKLSLGYNTNYVHEFYFDWPSYGGITIPGQFSHNLSANYKLRNGRYNITLEARNITGEDLYDNYSQQKPGRSFSVKLRYFIN